MTDSSTVHGPEEQFVIDLINNLDKALADNKELKARLLEMERTLRTNIANERRISEDAARALGEECAAHLKTQQELRGARAANNELILSHKVELAELRARLAAIRVAWQECRTAVAQNEATAAMWARLNEVIDE